MPQQEDLIWQERVSRGVTKALMRNFTSVADALKELIDNAVDYAWGQQVVISITHDRKQDLAVIESRGGRGMGPHEIQTWLNWGEGEDHPADHIGQYHQGGKAACGFLGRHLRLWTKHQDSKEVWYLEDEDWADRSEAKTFGPPRSLQKSQIPSRLEIPQTSQGYVRIEVRQLWPERKWNLADLRRSVSNTYRKHLQEGRLLISTIDAGKKEKVEPLDIPLSTAAQRQAIAVEVGTLKAKGWAGRLSRDQAKRDLKSGLRLTFNGRLVKDQEWFGYNYEGKGALNSLIGELELRGATPNPNKTDFVDRGNTYWDEFGEKVLRQLQPLIAELRHSAEVKRVTRQDRQLAQKVSKDIQTVCSQLSGLPLSGQGQAGLNGTAAAGRKPPTGHSLNGSQGRNGSDPNRKRPQPRTKAPQDSRGRLQRLVEEVTQGHKPPPVRVRSWDSNERSTWSTEGRRMFLDVNRAFPLYDQFNRPEAYIAETAILELCKPRAGDEPVNPDDYLDRVNLMLLRWSQLN